MSATLRAAALIALPTAVISVFGIYWLQKRKKKDKDTCPVRSLSSSKLKEEDKKLSHDLECTDSKSKTDCDDGKENNVRNSIVHKGDAGAEQKVLNKNKDQRTKGTVEESLVVKEEASMYVPSLNKPVEYATGAATTASQKANNSLDSDLTCNLSSQVCNNVLSSVCTSQQDLSESNGSQLEKQLESNPNGINISSHRTVDGNSKACDTSNSVLDKSLTEFSNDVFVEEELVARSNVQNCFSNVEADKSIENMVEKEATESGCFVSYTESVSDVENDSVISKSETLTTSPNLCSSSTCSLEVKTSIELQASKLQTLEQQVQLFDDLIETQNVVQCESSKTSDDRQEKKEWNENKLKQSEKNQKSSEEVPTKPENEPENTEKQLQKPVDNSKTSENSPKTTEDKVEQSVELSATSQNKLEHLGDVSEKSQSDLTETSKSDLKDANKVDTPGCEDQMQNVTEMESVFLGIESSAEAARSSSSSCSESAAEHLSMSSDSGQGGSTDPPTPPDSLNNEPHHTSTVVYEFNFPSDLCGMLIGRNGRQINNISVESGALISVKPKQFTGEYQTVSLQGTEKQVTDALEIIKSRFPPHKFPGISFDQCTSSDNPMYDIQLSQITLPEGGFVDVIVSSVVSLDKVFVQQPMHPSFALLNYLNECMWVCYNNGPGTSLTLPTPITENTLCVAPMFGGWFRAQVVETSEDDSQCLVRFVDYGGYCSLEPSSLRQIRTDFTALPFQAVECILHGINPSTSDDNSESLKAEGKSYLENIVRSRSLLAEVAGYTNEGTPVINLYQIYMDQLYSINEEVIANSAVLQQQIITQSSSSSAQNVDVSVSQTVSS